jgi:hypothetical protein
MWQRAFDRQHLPKLSIKTYFLTNSITNMDFTNTTARTFTSPSCTLDILTKNQTGIPNLQSLERVKPTGFDLQIESSPETGRATISGDIDRLKQLQSAVSGYVRQLVADFPLSQGDERAEDTTPLIGDPNCVIDDGNNDKASVFSLDRVENLLDKTKPNTPDGAIDRDAPLVAKIVSSNKDKEGIHLNPSATPLAHDLHLGDLRTDKGDRVVTLSALQLFDLSTVLDDCTAELAAAKTTAIPDPSDDIEPTVVVPPLARVSVGSQDEANTESTLATQLPNLPKLPASEDRYSRDMTSTRYNAPKPAFLSAIPWAAAAAVAVGAPVLLLGPNSNSLQELKTKLPQIQMPKVGDKQASPNPANTTTTAAATTGATTPSAYEPKPVPIPNAPTTGASPTPAVSPAAQQDGISVGALPPGMGEQSSIEMNGRSNVPATATTASQTKAQAKPPTTTTPITTAVPGGDITTTVGGPAPTVTSNSGITPNITATTTGKPKPTVATKPVKPAPTKTAKVPSVVPNLPSATSTSSIPGLASEMPSVTNLPGMSVPNVSVPGMTATATVDATGKPTSVGTKPAAKKAPADKKAPVAKKPAAKPAPKPTVAAKKPPIEKAPAVPAISNPIDNPTAQQPIDVPEVLPVETNPNVNLGADGLPVNGVPGGIDPAPNPQVATGSDPFDNPAVRDAKRFLKSKWKANANRPGALQYVVKVGAKTGVVKSVSPQGADSQAYLKQSGIIKPGQKMVSPAAAGTSDRILRAILNPDGSVEVISE